MDLQHHLDIHLNALPEVLAACQDADIDQVTILLNGRWTVRKLGQVRRQYGALTETELSGLRRALSKHGQGIATQVGWHFRQHASAQGWIIVAERLPWPEASLLSEQAQRQIKQSVEHGQNGVIIGPPGSHKSHILAWLTQQFVQDQIVLVSDLPPKESLGPRVIHLYPPQDRAQARSFSRFLSQCDAVLWDRVLHPYDLQDCMSHAGAKRRWVTFDAHSAAEGLQAFAKLWHVQPWGTLDALLVTEIPSPSTLSISGYYTRQADQWVAHLEPNAQRLAQLRALFPAPDDAPISTLPNPHRPHSLSTRGSSAVTSPTMFEPEGDQAPMLEAKTKPELLTPSRSALSALSPPSSPNVHTDSTQDISLRITGAHDPRYAASSAEIFEDSEGSLTRSAELNLESSSAIEEADAAQTVDSPSIDHFIDEDVRLIAQQAIMAPTSQDSGPQLVVEEPPDEPLTQELELDEDSAEIVSMSLALPMASAPEAQAQEDESWEQTQEYEPAPAAAPAAHIATHEPLYPESTELDLRMPDPPSIWSSAPLNEQLNAQPPKARAPQLLQLTDESSLLEFELPDPPAPSEPEIEEEDPDALYTSAEPQVADHAITNNVSKARLDKVLPALQDLLPAETSPSIASPINALMVDPLDVSEEDDVLAALDSLYADLPDEPLAPSSYASQLAWGDDEQTINRRISSKDIPHLNGSSRALPPSPRQATPQAPQEATTNSMSLRMSHLSERLKTLRQQRLGSGQPAPEEDAATPDEPTQITTINLNEIEAQAREQSAAKRKAELLRKLRDDQGDP